MSELFTKKEVITLIERLFSSLSNEIESKEFGGSWDVSSAIDTVLYTNLPNIVNEIDDESKENKEGK